MNERADVVFSMKDVSFRYRAVRALDGVTLDIHRGTRVALLGANGSGKSTLLRILDALEFPQGGTLTFDGQSISEEALRREELCHDFRRRVGFVFQNPDAQVFNATVHDEIAFGPLQLGWPKEEIRERIEGALAALGIPHLADRQPHRLSMGEKKRVAIASVLILEPEVVLLDEPTAMLDPRSQGQIVDLLFGWAGTGRTVVIATHDLASVADIADRCVVMNEGKIVAVGTPATILSNEELLRHAGLLHVHRHRHADGVVHAHGHVHSHGHGHEHE
jgi:cobalt/nickel transport system ATP-binding protein